MLPLYSKSYDQECTVYIGTYTNTGSKGIYIYKLNADGELRAVSVTENNANPSYLALHPSGQYLYAVNEVPGAGGRQSAAVAYKVHADDGSLTQLNKAATLGAGPCHLSVYPDGRYLLVANYAGGSVTVLPILSDGSLGEATCFKQHKGASVVADRQEAAHAHFIHANAEGTVIFVCDLGVDKIFIYQLDTKSGQLQPNDPPYQTTRAGSGPRHLTIHPNGRSVYVINELDSTLDVYEYNCDCRTVTHQQTLTTVPSDFTGTNYCSAIHIHPSGQYLYGSNRGMDTIVTYRINPASGLLQLMDYTDTQGNYPRDFAIDANGRWLLVANQNSDNLVLFQVDNQTGHLASHGVVAQVPRPVCVKISDTLATNSREQ
jgi:6-phosphogluconolactonase